MIDVSEATKIARAWVAERIDLKPTAWPSGAYAVSRPEDYFVFRVPSLGFGYRLGGDHYIAVHKVTGEVHDLGYIGD